MTKAIAQTYNAVHENLRRISIAFFVACLFLVFIYAINIFSVVSRTVSLQKVQTQIATIGSSVDSLDSEYLALSGKITPDNLNDYGMSQGKVSEYITKTTGKIDLGVASNINHVALTGHEL